jgi:hypothetical protein
MPKEFTKRLLVLFKEHESTTTEKTDAPKEKPTTATVQLIVNINTTLISPHQPITPKKQLTVKKEQTNKPAKPPKKPRQPSKRSQLRALGKVAEELKEMHRIEQEERIAVSLKIAEAEVRRVEKNDCIAGTLKRAEANARAKGDDLYLMESQRIELKI